MLCRCSFYYISYWFTAQEWDKSQDIEDGVTVVQGSEFGRTITPNSQFGSDHAWGGNYFEFGGETDGRKILDQYPKSFKEGDTSSTDRGRIIPTTPWESLWYGITQWCVAFVLFCLTVKRVIFKFLAHFVNFVLFLNIPPIIIFKFKSGWEWLIRKTWTGKCCLFKNIEPCCQYFLASADLKLCTIVYFC